MLNKNHIATGISVGLIFPVIAVTAARMLRDNLYLINKPALPYFIAIALNMVLTRILFRRNLHTTAKGVMLGTFVFMVIVLLINVHPLR